MNADDSFKFEITFDASQAKPGQDPFTIAPETLEIPQGLHKIEFFVTTVNGDGLTAVFNRSLPLLWFVGGVEVSEPIGFTWPEFQDGDTRMVIYDANFSGDLTTYGLEVNVVYGLQVFTSPDPSIVNLPPSEMRIVAA